MKSRAQKAQWARSSKNTKAHKRPTRRAAHHVPLKESTRALLKKGHAPRQVGVHRAWQVRATPSKQGTRVRSWKRGV